MLKLKDTPTQPATLTTEALEARVDELEFEKLQSETAQLMVSAEGYRNIGTVLNSTGVLSLEAAALAEVAEQLVGGGSSSLSDGLESHVVSGLEAEGKGEGFMAKAKELGAKAMEKIKKMIAWIIEKIKSVGLIKAKKVADAIKELGTTLETADLDSTVTVPKYVAEIIDIHVSNELRTYLDDDPFRQFDREKVYKSEETWEAYINLVVKKLAALSSESSPKVTDGFTLDRIPSGNTLDFKMSPDLLTITMKINKSTVNERGTVDVKVSTIKSNLRAIGQAVDYVSSFIKVTSKGMDDYNDELYKLFEVAADPRRIGTHLVLLRLLSLEIPKLALSGYQDLVNATNKLKYR